MSNLTFAQYAQQFLNSQQLQEQGKTDSVHGVSINSFMLVMTQNLQKHLNKNVKYHLGFLSNHGRNAYADEQGGAFYLTMHSDMFVGFLQFANFCFSQSAFLHQIGDAAKETSPKADEGFARGIGLFEAKKEVHPDKVVVTGRQMPLCPTRTIVAIHMGQMMARFVWLHEFAHCFRNHIKYIRGHNMGERLSEGVLPLAMAGFPTKSNYADHHQTYQMLEIDADYWAMEAMLRVQLGGTEPIKVLAKKHIDVRFTLNLFAIVTVCWMFEEFHKGLDDPNHPSNDLRQGLLMVHASRFIQQHCKEAMPLLVNVYKQFEIITRAIPGFHDLRSLRHLVKSKEMVIQMNERFRMLSVLREELAKLD